MEKSASELELQAELASLREMVGQLKSEVAELKTQKSGGELSVVPDGNKPTSRRRMLKHLVIGAAAVTAASTALVAGTKSASAAVEEGEPNSNDIFGISATPQITHEQPKTFRNLQIANNYFGVIGFTSHGYGVAGQGSNAGVAGFSGDFNLDPNYPTDIKVGVLGFGVLGVEGSGSDVGVQGVGNKEGSLGVKGSCTQTNGMGVLGEGAAVGVMGKSTNNTGVIGSSDNGTGISGTGRWTGVSAKATAADGIGVTGTGGKTGVSGTGSSHGIIGTGATGMRGSSTADPFHIGVIGSCNGRRDPNFNWNYLSMPKGIVGSAPDGYGGYFDGGVAPLFLHPAITAGAPPTQGHQKGEIWVDSAGDMFIFNGTAWRKVVVA